MSANFAKCQKQRIFSYIDRHTSLHCSILEFVRGAYNQAAVPGITRPLHATDRTSLKIMSLKKFQVIWQPYPTSFLTCALKSPKRIVE